MADDTATTTTAAAVTASQRRRHHRHKQRDSQSTHAGAPRDMMPQQQQPGAALSHSAEAAAADDAEEDVATLRAQLDELCALPENKLCSDCNDSGTRWASVNHGVFVCIRCAGVHRALGTHVSRVKSTTMDAWTASEVRLMRAIGNTRGKAMYEARLTHNDNNNNNNNSSSEYAHMTSSASDAQLRDFVERKYAQYAFACDDVRRLLRRVYKQVGYHAKTRSKTDAVAHAPSAAATSTSATTDGATTIATATAVTTTTTRDDDKPTRVRRTAVLKAFYGEDVTAAAKAAEVAAEDTTRVKAVHGTFGVVTVSASEHAARLQRLLTAFGAT